MIPSNRDENYVIQVNFSSWNHSGPGLDPSPIYNVHGDETVASNLGSSPPVIQHRDGDSPSREVGTVDRADHTRPNEQEIHDSPPSNPGGLATNASRGTKWVRNG